MKLILYLFIAVESSGSHRQGMQLDRAGRKQLTVRSSAQLDSAVIETCGSKISGLFK